MRCLLAQLRGGGKKLPCSMPAKADRSRHVCGKKAYPCSPWPWRAMTLAAFPAFSCWAFSAFSSFPPPRCHLPRPLNSRSLLPPRRHLPLLPPRILCVVNRKEGERAGRVRGSSQPTFSRMNELYTVYPALVCAFSRKYANSPTLPR